MAKFMGGNGNQVYARGGQVYGPGLIFIKMGIAGNSPPIWRWIIGMGQDPTWTVESTIAMSARPRNGCLYPGCSQKELQ